MLMGNATQASDSVAESRIAIQAQNWKLLQYLDFFRLLIAVLAAGIAFGPFSVAPFGQSSPAWFALFAAVYLVIAVLAATALYLKRPPFETQATVLAFLDVVFITLLLHTSGGITSQLGLLLIVAVGGTSLMLGRRLTLFYAALASVALLLQHSWGYFIDMPVDVTGYTQVGLLGLGLFASAFLGNTLATRLRETEQLAQRRGVDLANLSQVNEQIIKRMQSGVIVCDRKGIVRAVNPPTRRFFGFTDQRIEGALLATVSPELATQLTQWNANPANHARQLVRTRMGYALLPRFMTIGDRREDQGYLLFLEDTAALRQQAQQLKMAALARLTASIAHEIRNPLGAITNAAQLLAESPIPAGTEERKLLRIIEDQSRRMNVIVENVMQLSRRDHVNPSRFDLGSWLQDFVPMFCNGSDVPPGAFEIVKKGALEVCMDAEQLYQVCANLCQNALRHSPAYKDRPILRLEIGLDAEQHPVLDVIDWGTGVAPEIVDNIFDPFFTTTPKGTGLGLYIARELCEGNGARVDYHPNDGGGSRFRISFARPDDCAPIATS